MDIDRIQDFLRDHDLDGWLLADFHGRNTIAVELLGLSGLVTRRSFFFVPAYEEPVVLAHATEAEKFRTIPCRLIIYAGYQALEQELKKTLHGVKRLAMEYSPLGRLPYIGLVDAGTVELVREWGIEVVSSADLVAHFQARLTVEQIAAHRIAAGNVIEIKEKTFRHIGSSLQAGDSLTESSVVRFIMDRFEEYDMVTAFPPICAVNQNAGNPHYEPSDGRSRTIKRGDLILIDLWGKIKQSDGVYADITWMAHAGPAADIPPKHRDLFAVVTGARDAAVAFIRENVGMRPVLGSQVDDVCRAVVVEAGYGPYFTHRTGHSITSSEHGPGPNIDNLETEDRRKLRQGHLFSIEPGIYMNDCGFRSEINVLIGHNGAEITTLPLQDEIVALL